VVRRAITVVFFYLKIIYSFYAFPLKTYLHIKSTPKKFGLVAPSLPEITIHWDRVHIKPTKHPQINREIRNTKSLFCVSLNFSNFRFSSIRIDQADRASRSRVVRRQERVGGRHVVAIGSVDGDAIGLVEVAAAHRCAILVVSGGAPVEDGDGFARVYLTVAPVSGCVN